MEYITAKTILTKKKDTDSWFGTDYNMNIYRGCCHGCIYCDSRSDCYQNKDFDTVKPKADALKIIESELKKKSGTGVVATGAMSDPYNPLEKQLKLTRGSLKLLNDYGFGAAIATKSDLITRDIDLLCAIKEHSPVLCKITITSADDALGKKIEPFAPPSSARFEAIRKLSSAGIFTGILLMPVLPWITDSEENITSIIEKAADAGAKFIYPGFGVTMRDSQRDYLYEKLDELFPGLTQKYKNKYENRYSCGSENYKTLWPMFREECEKYGILYQMPDIIKAYKKGYDSKQMTLF